SRLWSRTAAVKKVAAHSSCRCCWSVAASKVRTRMIVLVGRPTSRNPELPVNTTRERIIDATRELFMERGYAASGLKEISKAGTAPIGSLYHFFPGGKEELAAETLRAAGAADQALVETIVDNAPPLVHRTRRWF